MGQKISVCQQEQLDRQSSELHYDDDSGEFHSSSDSRGGCCKKAFDEPPVDSIPSSASMAQFESLSYMPVRFDEGSTIDAERSHARYSKIVVHSTRARTQRRSKAWEDWLRGATAGRAITLLQGFESPGDDEKKAPGENAEICLTKTPATYHLDRGLTKFSIVQEDAEGESQPTAGITLLVDNIQVICPAMDFMLFFDQVESKLTESEKARAVLLQYVTEDTERKRVCFLEETEQQKDRFVQALTALWLEKRNDHSMWF